MTSSTARSWPAVLGELIERRDLAEDDTAWAMDEIMAGDATPAQLAAFAVLLRAKGESPSELAGLVRTMLARATPLDIVGRAVDIVGTGGDRAHTVNISTMAALVVAGSGRRVVKHGNRAASSSCGTADVLEELGVAIDLPPAGVVRTVDEVGIGFCFAPVFHAGMRHAGPVRGQLGVPTAFNFLGPLSNPARVSSAAIGCAAAAMAPGMAQVLARRGDSALVFRGDDGLDELTTTTTSSMWIAARGTVRTHVLDPRELDIAPVSPAALRGGDRAFNAAVVREVLTGGAPEIRDVVVLNAAAGIAAYDGLDDLADASDAELAAGMHATFERGLRLARESITTGAAAGVLDHWVGSSRSARAELAHAAAQGNPTRPR